MNIYIAHSSNFDYEKELYQPIRNSNSNEAHTIVLPHETSDELYDTRKFFEDCDLVIAEISLPSTGMGIELGWAIDRNISIIALHRKDTMPSKSINAIAQKVYTYEMIDEISNIIDTVLRSYED